MNRRAFFKGGLVGCGALVVPGVVQELDAKNIVAAVTPGYYAQAYVRLAPSLLTDERDLERTIAAVASI